MNTAADREHTIIYVTAHTGHVRAARGLVGRAIRAALAVRKWYSAPHHVAYGPGAEMRSEMPGSPPAFTLSTTPAELDLLLAQLDSLAAAEGWDVAPVDVYRG